MTRAEIEKSLREKYPWATEHDIEQIVTVMFFKQEMAKLLNRG